MARKDEILKSFLEHELLVEKYRIDQSSLPTTLRSALNSDEPIIKAIGLIIENIEPPNFATDANLRNVIMQYLNEAAV